MPAPYPYDAVAGRVQLRSVADEIVAHYAWIARWSDEIGKDTDLDLKKLAQLAFVHCRLFRERIQAFLPIATDSPLIPALRRAFDSMGVEWPTRAAMIADLSAIYQECANLWLYVRDNVPAARSFATRTYDASGAEIEQPAKIAKDPAITTEVAKIRALFG